MRMLDVRRGSVPEKVLVGSRAKYALLTAGAAVFVAIGGFLIKTDSAPKTQFEAWLCILFFGLCGAIGAANVMRPSRLVLSDNAFRLERPLGKPRTVEWRDIDAFFVWTNRSSKILGYRYIAGRAPTDALTRINQSLGLDGGLPTGWSLSTEELVNLMNQYRMKASPSA